MVAWKADDALDEMEGGVDGVVEDDDVATLDGRGWEDQMAEAGGVFGGARLLVDQEEVADEEGRFHRLGGYAKGLDAEGDDEDGDDNDGEERLHGGEEAVGFVMGVVAVMRGVVIRDVERRGAWRRGRRGVAWGHVGVGNRVHCAASSGVGSSVATRRWKARRAASCWASFFVAPSASARAVKPPSLSSTRTSMRKRFW